MSRRKNKNNRDRRDNQRSDKRQSKRRNENSSSHADRAFVYGWHALEQLLKISPRRVKTIYVQQDRKDKRAQSIQALAQDNNISVQARKRDEFDQQFSDASHQGVVAEISPAQVQNEQFLESLLVKKEKPFLLILDQVQDPHNVGAILRSAAAIGVDAVIAPNRNACGLTAAVRKVAVGCAELVPYVQVTNLARTLRLLSDQYVRIYGLAGEATTSLYDVTKDANGIAIVMGNEAKGMRRLTREHCDELIYIPMQAAVESLNVSVATGITLFHFAQLNNQA